MSETWRIWIFVYFHLKIPISPLKRKGQLVWRANPIRTKIWKIRERKKPVSHAHQQGAFQIYWLILSLDGPVFEERLWCWTANPLVLLLIMDCLCSIIMKWRISYLQLSEILWLFFTRLYLREEMYFQKLNLEVLVLGRIWRWVLKCPEYFTGFEKI